MTDIFAIQYFTPLLIAFFVILLIREYVSFRKILTLKYITTPLVTCSIIFTCFQALNVQGIHYFSFMVMLGLLLSLVADTLLMIEEVNLFLQGLVYFLFAHVAYIAAFSTGYVFYTWNIPLALVILAAALLYYREIWKARGTHYIPALVYMIILGSMLFFAVTSLNNGINQRGLFLTVGAVFFVLSDIVLGYNTFIRPIPHSTVLTWSLYAPAQMFIAISCYY
ncbi:MAG: lysoplasmalogenase [Spirochaetota bacterium]